MSTAPGTAGPQRSDFRFFDRLRVRWAEVDLQKIVFNPHPLGRANCSAPDHGRF